MTRVQKLCAKHRYYNAVQKKCLDSIVGTGRAVYYYDMGDKVVIAHNGFSAHIIPKQDLMIDISKLQAFSNNPICSDEGYISANITSDAKILPDRIIIKIASPNGDVWVNRELLKQFPTMNSVKTQSPVSPVKLYDSGELIGIVLPVRKLE